jgi:hypothetical protein
VGGQPPIITLMPMKVLLRLFVGILVIGLFSSHATLSVDPPNRYLVAKSMVDYGDLRVRLIPGEPKPPGVDPGIDGWLYSRFGIGQALIFVGPYWICRHGLGIESDRLTRSIISLTVFPLTLALTAMFFFLLARDFGFTDRTSYVAAILLILATGLWQTSKEGQEDSHLALLFMIAAFGLRRFQIAGALGWLAASAGCIGFSFLTRSDTAPAVLFYLLLAGGIIAGRHRSVLADTSRGIIIQFLIVLAGTLPALAIHSWLCYRHFGDWLTPPHAPFSAHLLPMGLAGLLLSPGRSLFLYNPAMLLSIPGFILLWRQHRGWALFIFAAFIGSLFLYSATENFHGNCCWGPRYLTRYFPLLFIPVLFVMNYYYAARQVTPASSCDWSCHPANCYTPDIKSGKFFGRGVVGVILTLSVLVQVAAVSGHHVRELGQLQQAYNVGWSDRQWTMFEPGAHFLEIRLANLSDSVQRMAAGRIGPWSQTPNQLLSIDEQLDAPVLNYLAFWPFHLTYYLPVIRPGLSVPLWGSTAIFLAGIAFGLLCLYSGNRCIRNEEKISQQLLSQPCNDA